MSADTKRLQTIIKEQCIDGTRVTLLSVSTPFSIPRLIELIAMTEVDRNDVRQTLSNQMTHDELQDALDADEEALSPVLRELWNEGEIDIWRDGQHIKYSESDYDPGLTHKLRQAF